ncbi:glycosyltransferase [Mycobacterium sp. 852002-51163_SCH5372311]|uniref:glycosyltransferase n=1 Tax=Mycobacterium sp. 852002-51163_SCH5372311 TaxID=1834097 RepID=UPI0009EEDF73|nr:nucleotide disphospho-sugar-binding domain-containing protein [Mycobacterium sp. 852002-51163_SCH5372311]
MRVLFALVDGGGNIPPQLAVARALRARGAEIHFIGHQGIRDRVQDAGFSFESFRTGRELNPTAQRSLLSLTSDFTKTAMDRRLGSDVVTAAQRNGADVVVVDVLLTAAAYEVVASSIPTVVLVHFFYRGLQDLAAGPAGWLLRLRGTPPLGLERAAALRIVTSRSDLDPMRGTPPVRHVGVVWQGTPSAATAMPVPRLLISLSTCAFAGQRRMLQHILDAVEPLPVEATVTVGPAIDASGLRVPANASLHAWLDHDEVLATSSLVVGHGGHSTTMRALSFGVPLVVMPANTLIDQKRVGAVLENVGAGILLRKHASARRIRSAISTVLADPAYRAAAGRLGESIRERDGAETAADAISEFAESYVAH